MLIQTLRLRRGWSQEQLATITGLSPRTIQRIERGQTPSLDSLQALASAFNVDVSDLTQPTETSMKHNAPDPLAEQRQEQLLAYSKVRRLKGFYLHVIRYVVVIAGLALINLMTSPNNIWFIWPMLGWGLALVIHALAVFTRFTLFSTDWERRTAERYLGRKL